jgi:hypothetical protein
MKIPSTPLLRMGFYRDLVDACLASSRDRQDLYNERRYYWLHGTSPGSSPSPWNRIYPHIELVTSFLYAPDSTRFSMEFGDSVPDVNFSFAEPFTKRLNNRWKDSGHDQVYHQALIKSLVYDTCLVKTLRQFGKAVPYVVEPGCFGVLREDIMGLDRQEAFVHTYSITLTELDANLETHPQRNKLMEAARSQVTRSTGETAMPTSTPKIILSAFSPSMIGRVNDVTGQTEAPSYAARVNVDMAEMSELWVWNDDTRDWQTVTLVGGGDVVYDRPNIFMPRKDKFEPEHPFVQVCPNPMADYFWGVSETSRLKELQDYRNDRMAQIQELLQKQVKPPTAYSGMGLQEEKLHAFGTSDSYLSLGMGEKVEVFQPSIPQDVWNDIHENDQAFMEASGISNILSGRGDSGVRSKGQTTELARLGSARIKNRGLRVEMSLEKGAHLLAKCICLDDDAPMTATVQKQKVDLVPAQMDMDFTIRVDSHSNSPIVVEDTKQDAEILLKAGAITKERFIELLHPPMTEVLLRDYRDVIAPAEAKAAQQKAELEAQKAGGAPGGMQRVK